MPSDPGLSTLARAALTGNLRESWDNSWDSRGTAPKKCPKASNTLGHLMFSKINCMTPLSHRPRP